MKLINKCFDVYIFAVDMFESLINCINDKLGEITDWILGIY